VKNVRLVYLLGLLTMLVLLTGCGRAVVFATQVGTSGLRQPGALSLYIDRDGSLYPIDTALHRDERQLRSGEGYLLNYYASQPARLRQLYAGYGVSDLPAAAAADPEEGWPAFQALLRRQAAAAVNQRLDQLGAGATLVVLIHGFNNTPDEATKSFEAVEARLRAEHLPQGPYQVLRVYWDGRRGAIPFFFKIAQPNAQFVGLGLRGILSRVSHAHPVRIITHSLGTLAGCNALWNVVTSMGMTDTLAHAPHMVFWQNLTTARNGRGVPRYYYARACHDTANYQTPTHPDLRMGCIAAATPGDTYLDYLNRTPGLATTNHNGLYRRIVISYNPTDIVLNKLYVFAFLHRTLGITNLGRTNYAYNIVAERVNHLSTGGRSYQVPFYGCHEKGKFNHGLTGYANSNQMPTFLNVLLSDSPPPAIMPCPR
jgi:hypothetical protein